MKDLFIIFGLIVAVLVIGVGLFFYGPASFRSVVGNSSMTTFRLLKEGDDAVTMDTRANYQITDNNQLSQLWGYVNTTPGTAPNIDFTKEEVLAIFDGTHTTTGYSIKVTGITDADGIRTVHVSRIAPGANCGLTPGITAPYQIIAVPKSNLTLTHVDTSTTQNCS